MNRSVRVLIADDHEFLRIGLREILETGPGIEIVAEASDGPSVIQACAQFRPDVLILDVEMPGEGATATVRAVREVSPRTKILVLTMHDEADVLEDLLAEGAKGFVTKGAGIDEMVMAVRAVAREDDNVVLAISRGTFEDFRRGRPLDLLSEREQQVLELAASGMSNRQIATRLSISEGTVKRHLANVNRKLGSTNRVEAFRLVQERRRR